MEQHDMLADQIEEIGKMLLKIVSNFNNSKNLDTFPENLETANKALKAEIDLDVNHLLAMDKVAMKNYLTERKLGEIQLEILATYFEEVGTRLTDLPKAQLYYSCAINLLDTADEVSNTLSYERIDQKEKLRRKRRSKLI